jgi:hypothetical protein
MWRRLPLAGMFILAVGAGCATTVIHPTQEDVRRARARWPAVTLNDLEQGRKLYVRKCAGCHNLHRPDEYGPERWPELVAKMRTKSGISDPGYELIVRYLITACEVRRSVSPRAGG